LLRGWGALESVLEEGQIELVEQGRLHPREVRQLDVLQPDAAAGEGAEELQEVGIAGGLFADLADERQPEAAAGARQRNGQRLACRIQLEVADGRLAEHALGVSAGLLQVETERRQTTQDDANARALALRGAQRGEQA